MIANLWLALKASRGAQIVLGVGLLMLVGLALYIWAVSQHRETVAEAVEQGRVEQREEAATETLNRTLEAINAEEAVRHDPAVRDAACLRHARNPTDC